MIFVLRPIIVMKRGEGLPTTFAETEIDIDTAASRLQDGGAASFVKSWNELVAVIVSKSAVLERVG